MTLSDLSIRRPVFAWMLMSALMFFGVICFFQLGVSQLPEATQPVLTITANWVGAAPEVMETEIVNPIEQAVISVQGIQDIESNMRQGTASIKLTFYTNKNIDAALQETNSKLRSVKLPDDVLPPTIDKINTDDNPIMWLAITSTKRSFKDVLTYVDLNLRDRLRVIPGVGDIILGGWSDRNLRVWVDNDKLLERQLTNSRCPQHTQDGEQRDLVGHFGKRPERGERAHDGRGADARADGRPAHHAARRPANLSFRHAPARRGHDRGRPRRHPQPTPGAMGRSRSASAFKSSTVKTT